MNLIYFCIVLILTIISLSGICCTSMSERDEQVIAFTDNEGATMGIGLRHKIFMPPTDHNTIIVTFARSYGNLKISRDSGNSWEKFYTDYKALLKWLDSEALTVSPYLDFHSAMDGNGDKHVFLTFPSHTDKRQKFIRYDYTHGVISKAFSLKDDEPNHHKRGTLTFDGENIWVFTRTSRGKDIKWKGSIRFHRSRDKGNTWYSHPSDFGYVDRFNQNTRVGALIWNRKPTLIVWLGRDFKYKYYYWDNNNWFSPKGSELSIKDSHPLTRQFGAATSSGNLHLVWQDQIDGVLKEAWKSSGEKLWNQQIVEVNRGNDDFLPVMTAKNDRVYAFYSFLEEDGKRNIFGRVKENDAWSDRFRISTSGNNCRHPNVPQKISKISNFIPIIWVEGNEAPYRICFKKIWVNKR